MMIDAMRGSVALRCPLPSPIRDGAVLKISNSGEVEWETAGRVMVEGSYAAKFAIRAPSLSEIEFSGNPAKFLQGHNLYGPSDPAWLLWIAFKRIEAIGGVFPCSVEEMGFDGPWELAEATTLRRVDCTAMFLLDTPEDVLWFLKSATVNGRLSDRGESGLAHPFRSARGKVTGVTFGSRPGKSFTHRGLTLYSKGLDTQVHPLPEFMMVDADIIAYVNRCLRAEVRLERNYLAKRGLNALSAWCPERAGLEWTEMMGRMVWNEADVQPGMVEGLPTNLRLIYAAWTAGADLSSIYSRASYYRHRSAIKKALGVDIAIPYPKEPTAEVVPIKRRVFDLNQLIAGRPPWADRVDAELRQAGAFVFEEAA